MSRYTWSWSCWVFGRYGPLHVILPVKSLGIGAGGVETLAVNSFCLGVHHFNLITYLHLPKAGGANKSGVDSERTTAVLSEACLMWHDIIQKDTVMNDAYCLTGQAETSCFESSTSSRISNLVG